MRTVLTGLMILVFSACGDDVDSTPTFDEVTRVVIVGDNAAGNPELSTSYAALLVANDDALFPAFVGKDLTTALGAPTVERLERGGDSFHALATLDQPVCQCGAPCSDRRACTDAGSTEPTLVIVQLGHFDILDIVVRLTVDPLLGQDMDALTEAFRAEVAAVLDYIVRDAFATRPLVVVVEPYDPSDGAGNLPQVVEATFPNLPLGNVDGEPMRQMIANMITVIGEEADRIGAAVVPVNEHFRGHGYNYDDTNLPDYDAADPTLWLQRLLDPNHRGAHEMRRLIWRELTGESITAAVGVLPDPPDETTLPTVPDPDGWADAIADSDITPMFVDGTGVEWPNVAADPIEALGAAGGGADDAVAIGVDGAYVVVDLGAGQEAVDGPGDDLVVVEYGPSSGGAPEPYRVSVAETEAGPFIAIADARGERAFDLSIVGLSSVRYVRIESQSHIPDLISGLGSPLYPGPELDAVGAVYPGGVGIP